VGTLLPFRRSMMGQSLLRWHALIVVACSLTPAGLPRTNGQAVPSVVWTYQGTSPGDTVGYGDKAFAAVGDVDGDGCGDVLIGAPQSGVVGSAPTGPGYAVLCSGATGTTIHTLRGLHFTQAAAREMWAWERPTISQ
jgi:hypothetical protein